MIPADVLEAARQWLHVTDARQSTIADEAVATLIEVLYPGGLEAFVEHLAQANAVS